MPDATHHLTTFLMDGNCGKIWYVKGLYENVFKTLWKRGSANFFTQVAANINIVVTLQFFNTNNVTLSKTFQTTLLPTNNFTPLHKRYKHELL